MSVAVGIAQPRRAPSPVPRLTSDVDQRRHDHAADRRGDRQRRPARVAQVAGDELALELQPGDEEEDRQQPVGGPGRPASGPGAAPPGPTVGVPQRGVAGAQGEFAQTSATSAPRRAAATPPTVSLRRTRRDAAGLRPGAAAEQAAGRDVAHEAAPGLRGRRGRCRPDFPAHRGPSLATAATTGPGRVRARPGPTCYVGRLGGACEAGRPPSAHRECHGRGRRSSSAPGWPGWPPPRSWPTPAAGAAARPGARAVPGRPGLLVVRRPVPGRQPGAAPDGHQGLARAGPGRTGWARARLRPAARTTGRARWAEAYVDFAAGEKRSWLHGRGVRLVPAGRLGRARRLPGRRARQLGAPLPRHLGHRPGRGRAVRAAGRASSRAGRVELRFRHRVDGLTVTGGRGRRRARRRPRAQRGRRAARRQLADRGRRLRAARARR